jgi:hypothetical protein
MSSRTLYFLFLARDINLNIDRHERFVINTCVGVEHHKVYRERTANVKIKLYSLMGGV